LTRESWEVEWGVGSGKKEERQREGKKRKVKENKK